MFQEVDAKRRTVSHIELDDDGVAVDRVDDGRTNGGAAGSAPANPTRRPSRAAADRHKARSQATNRARAGHQ
jgi:hypothetical protein